MENLEKMTMSEVIEEINRLAKIKKERDLTKDESDYRENLKVVYLKHFRAGFEQQLKNTKVVDSEGKDITPSKIKKQGEAND
ncbi:DUF896 family protein [Mesoplasma chauliocola]|uniref:DUF896 family protein n=1 Tax=Mesoplasma chauliocola TaxID=216427 RepID=A0A249SND8_9MOLU|nr:DUF896 domain-containing protein [Mesoplasma chauliocola]ASZ09113.1 DUF896 family protein [Mesoplasma chauliocola]